MGIGYQPVEQGFEALWIAGGLIGYWELILHLQKLVYLKQLPASVWKVVEGVLPILGLGLWSFYVEPNTTIVVFVSFVIAVLGLNAPPRRRLHTTLWAAWIVSSLLVVVPLHVLRNYNLVQVLDEGAQLLGTAIPFWIYIRERSHRGQLMRERLEDPLTGAMNRRGLTAWMAERMGQKVNVLIIDLDDFKFVNDSLGHDVGDLILVEVARRIRQGIRDTDIVVRWGGDEFVCVIAADPEASTQNIGERIHQHIVAHPMDVGNGRSIRVRACVGAAQGVLDETLEKRADQMLLQAKRRGKNQVCSWSDDTVEVAVDASPLRWVADAMRSLVEYSPQGFVLTDQNHYIVDVNATFERITGYKRAELVGYKPKMLAKPDGTNAQKYPDMRRELEAHGFWQGVFVNQRPDGEVWHSHETITAVTVGDTVVGYWALIEC